jgi:hypothetical protein
MKAACPLSRFTRLWLAQVREQRRLERVWWLAVARLARVIAVDVPHHVTQRGNARQIHFELRCRPQSLSRLAAAIRAIPSSVAGRLLADVESRSSHWDPAQCRCVGTCLEAHSWPICIVLERVSHLEWAICGRGAVGVHSLATLMLSARSHRELVNTWAFYRYRLPSNV